MSITDISTFETGNPIFDKAGASGIISLNSLFKLAIRKVQEASPGVDMIVRYDTLPQVAGSESDFATLFETMLLIMVERTGPGNELLLHLKCEELPAGNFFLMHFHTNITDHRSLHDQRLEQCMQLISAHGGTFTVNYNKNTGDLFSITLPGKPE